MNRFFSLCFLCLAAGCNPPMPAAEYGAVVFNDSAFAGTRLNAYACSTCHAVRDGDPRLLPGYAFNGATGRTRFWGGQIERLIDASSFCYQQYMFGAGPLDADEPRSRALYEYLNSLPDPANTPQLPFTIVHSVALLPGGNAVAGKTTYSLACKSCHGELHSGSGRLTTRASLLPDIKDDYARLFPGVDPALVVIEKVRHGNSFGISGTMAPFSQEALSDEALADILAYLGL